MIAEYSRIAAYAIELLNEQIREGVDETGKQYAYSTKPFAIPSGALRAKTSLKNLRAEGKISEFKTNGGALWVLIHGGYSALRAMRNQNPDGDYLQASGAMLRALTILRANDTEIVVGFADKKQAQKAFWLTQSGAGKSRSLWRFMGLTAQNQQRLAEYAAEQLGINPNVVFPKYRS